MRIQRQRVYSLVAMTGLAFCFLAVGLMLYWSFSKSNVLVINNAPVPVRTVYNQPGPNSPTSDGVVILKIDYCKKVEANGKIRASFVSEASEMLLPMYDERQGVGCHVVEAPLLIPKNLPSGRYHIHYQVTYRVNPLKNVVVEFDSLNFEIAK